MRIFERLRKHSWLEDVSAYVDGELSPAHLARFEATLASTPEARDAVRAEREARALLRSALPELPAPRSFALTAEIAAANRPVRVPPVAGQARVFSRAAGAVSVMAAAAFLVVLVVDTSGSSGGDDDALQSAGGAESQTSLAAGTDLADDAKAGNSLAPFAEAEATPAGDLAYSATEASDGSDEDSNRNSTDAAGETSALTALEPDDRTTGGLGAVKVIFAIVAVAGGLAFIFTRRLGGNT
ncbi:MAG TPA: hypothetical protein VFK32_06840 [Tepidiformaceae bacterium]|nr:hypothetical protein [Tepidiformaceae bacterium]